MSKTQKNILVGATGVAIASSPLDITIVINRLLPTDPNTELWTLGIVAVMIFLLVAFGGMIFGDKLNDQIGTSRATR